MQVTIKVHNLISILSNALHDHMSLCSPLDEVHLSSLVKAQLKSLMEQSSAEVVVAASAAGDISTIRAFLQDNPTEVRDGLNTYSVKAYTYMYHIHVYTIPNKGHSISIILRTHSM